MCYSNKWCSYFWTSRACCPGQLPRRRWTGTPAAVHSQGHCHWQLKVKTSQISRWSFSRYINRHETQSWGCYLWLQGLHLYLSPLLHGVLQHWWWQRHYYSSECTMKYKTCLKYKINPFTLAVVYTNNSSDSVTMKSNALWHFQEKIFQQMHYRYTHICHIH